MRIVVATPTPIEVENTGGCSSSFVVLVLDAERVPVHGVRLTGGFGSSMGLVPGVYTLEVHGDRGLQRSERLVVGVEPFTVRVP